jgi:hypothetical protein
VQLIEEAEEDKQREFAHFYESSAKAASKAVSEAGKSME